MATAEQIILDGLVLNDPVGAYVLRDPLEVPPPRQIQDWVKGADSDGAVLLRTPKYENRTIRFKLRISGQASMDACLTQIGALVQKLQECPNNTGGLPLVWTPANSTKALTAYVFSGEVEELPITKSGDDLGWFRAYPTLTVRLDCDPFLYAPEVLSSTTSGTSPLLTMTLASVPGDVPAIGRLIVSDLASQSRRYCEWGVQNRYYDAATSLQLTTAADLTISGFAGTSTTRAGSFSTNVFRGSLGTSPTAVCGITNQGHVGSYRAKARVFVAPASGTPGDVAIRLSYQDGDGPFRAGTYAFASVANAWCEVDLGVITITEKRAGTQKWAGRLEAYSKAAGDTVDFDIVKLFPVSEGYGKARATYNYQSGALVARDEFTGTTAGGVLNARTAPTAQVWATSGATGDFAFSDNGFGTGSEEVSRQTGLIDTGYGRLARLGATSYTDVEVGVKFLGTGSTNQGIFGPLARYVDDAHFAGAEVVGTDYGFGPSFRIVVALGLSSWIEVASTPFLMSANTPYVVRLVVYSSGTIVGRLEYASGGLIAQLKGSHSALATGGSLATGTPGFRDLHINLGTNARYDNFYAATPAAEPIAIYSGKAAEVRSDTTIRQDASGTYYGPVPAYRGSYFFVPPAGDKNRTSRLAVSAHRNDIETSDDANIADNLQLQVGYTSRFVVAPR